MYIYIYIYTYISYLVSPKPTLGHLRGGSLNHPVFFRTLLLVKPKVTCSFITRSGPKALMSPSVAFEPF